MASATQHSARNAITSIKISVNQSNDMSGSSTHQATEAAADHVSFV
jgi:hypothetical protein